MNDKIMNKLFDINAKLETVQTTAGHLYNIIEDAETDTHEKSAVFLACNQSTILALLSVIIDYVATANAVLDKVQNTNITEAE